MSFGFSVGDFITVIDRANIIRANFVGAPAQFRALSDEYGAAVSPVLLRDGFSLICSSIGSGILLSW